MARVSRARRRVRRRASRSTWARRGGTAVPSAAAGLTGRVIVARLGARARRRNGGLCDVHGSRLGRDGATPRVWSLCGGDHARRRGSRSVRTPPAWPAHVDDRRARRRPCGPLTSGGRAGAGARTAGSRVEVVTPVTPVLSPADPVRFCPHWRCGDSAGCSRRRSPRWHGRGCVGALAAVRRRAATTRVEAGAWWRVRRRCRVAQAVSSVFPPRVRSSGPCAPRRCRPEGVLRFGAVSRGGRGGAVGYALGVVPARSGRLVGVAGSVRSVCCGSLTGGWARVRCGLCERDRVTVRVGFVRYWHRRGVRGGSGRVGARSRNRVERVSSWRP